MAFVGTGKDTKTAANTIVLILFFEENFFLW